MRKQSTHSSDKRFTFSRKTSTELIMALVAWFHSSQRKLKFRETRDPYAIMVSEFMLQQTTVATVGPYYERFLLRFPNIETLGSSSEEEVLALWAGLGYYRRARQLRAAAQAIIANHGSKFPRTVEELQKLPGFGRYTAGAVLSSAFDQPAPILEANTIRVFARITGQQGMIGIASYMKFLWSVSESLVQVAKSPRQFNLSAMELGALICKPQPRCEICPVQSICIAYRLGNPAQIPQIAPRREKVFRSMICLVLQNAAGHFLIRKIPTGEWHAGMWEFPSQPVIPENPDSKDAEVLCQSWLGIQNLKFSSMATVKYQVTHHSITSHVFRCYAHITAQETGRCEGEFRFASLSEISVLPLGSAQRKICRMLEMDFQEIAL